METDPTIDTQNVCTQTEPDAWHVVQQPDGHCEICTQGELNSSTDAPNIWGPFTSRNEAIAKRVGLIRAGKCSPQ
ncbi:hypothetical protein [Leptothoe sp. PORK10 BA2]|uniref:hypothetical protein n=1 Tax=Leptothoe sp. PORK10 BA2 TaxID=3110254 RepID=UPI002B221362|nr:hypothetical protein [Leptothoe sp. PORK10 BA2]MEA5462339.1 hypothetical protein [Leptothoe sp. PORK10 BA2]